MRKVDILKRNFVSSKKNVRSKTMGTMTVVKFASREAISYVVIRWLPTGIMHNV